jgi:hypothetical protein
MDTTTPDGHRREARRWLETAQTAYEHLDADDAQVTSAATIAVAHALLALATLEEAAADE